MICRNIYMEQVLCITKKIIRFKKCVIDTKNLTLKSKSEKISQNKNLEIVAFSESGFASDKETSICVTGFS